MVGPQFIGGPTTKGLNGIKKWLGDKKWDLIHFNWGLHDLKYMGPNGENLRDPADKKNHQQVPPAEYEKNLRKLVDELKKTKAKLIWRNTTPVPDGAKGRVVGDSVKYNLIAAKIMKEHGIQIHDMYSLVEPKMSELMLPKGDVHFKKTGYQILADNAVEVILGSLEPSLTPKQTPGSPRAPPTIEMFDGKTLDGWDADPKFWSVEDGAITGRTTKQNPTKGNTFCIWKGGDASDFELNLEFRIEGHNSGIQFRSFPLPNAPDRWRLGGYQADFDAANNWSGTLFGEKFRTILAKRGERSVITGAKMNNGKKPKLVAQRKAEPLDDAKNLTDSIKAYPEWNRYRIIATGNQIELYINDKLMSVCTDDDQENRRATGLFGLQLHAGPPMKVQFKNFELTPLEKPAPKLGQRVAFEEDFENGLDRWEIVDPKSWKLEDHGQGKSLSIIERKSEYKPEVRSPRHIALLKYVEAESFELTFKVKSTKNTGNHRDCCVFFNYQDPTHFYYVHLGAKPDPASGQIMIVNAAPRAPLTKNEKDTPWSESGWHDVKLIRDVSSGKIAIYFDDMETPHMEVEDKTFGMGRIGLGSFDDMNAFDAVKLKIIDLP